MEVAAQMGALREAAEGAAGAAWAASVLAKEQGLRGVAGLLHAAGKLAQAAANATPKPHGLNPTEFSSPRKRRPRKRKPKEDSGDHSSSQPEPIQRSPTTGVARDCAMARPESRTYRRAPQRKQVHDTMSDSVATRLESRSFWQRVDQRNQGYDASTRQLFDVMSDSVAYKLESVDLRFCTDPLQHGHGKNTGQLVEPASGNVDLVSFTDPFEMLGGMCEEEPCTDGDVADPPEMLGSTSDPFEMLGGMCEEAPIETCFGMGERECYATGLVDPFDLLAGMVAHDHSAGDVVDPFEMLCGVCERESCE